MHSRKQTRIFIALALLIVAGVAVACGAVLRFSGAGWQRMLAERMVGGARSAEMAVEPDAYEPHTQEARVALSGSVTGENALVGVTLIRCDALGQELPVAPAGELSAVRSRMEAQMEGRRFALAEVYLTPGDNYFALEAVAQDGQRARAPIHITYDALRIRPLETAAITQDTDGTAYVNDLLILYFGPDTTEEQAARVVEAIGGKVEGYISLLRQYQVRVEAESLEALRELAERVKREHPEVVRADLETVHTLQGDALEEGQAVNPPPAQEAAPEPAQMAVPQDPWSARPGPGVAGDWNEALPGGNNWNLEAIQVQSAWTLSAHFRTFGLGVIDVEFMDGHDDLQLTFLTEPRGSGVHGTHVAGIIGATVDNEIGISGILREKKLMAYAFDVGEGEEVRCTDSDLMGALVACVQSGASVVNLSMGDRLMEPPRGEAEYLAFAQRQGEQYAYVMGLLLSEGYDFVVVQAAGNGDASGVGIDARYAGIFASVKEIANMEFTGGLLSDYALRQAILDRILLVANAENQTVETPAFALERSSNGGELVDIAAPGTEILSTVYNGRLGLGGYAILSGTSMAAPHVTAVAGMAWSANPELRGSDIKRLLIESARYTAQAHPESPWAGDAYPLVNAYEAVRAALAFERDDAVVELRVSDASTDQLLPARIEIYEGIQAGGPLAYQVNVGPEGVARVPLSSGDYVLRVSSEGYIDLTNFRIRPRSDRMLSYQVPLSRELGADEFRVVLTWGENPPDLDSHLSGLDATGAPVHVFYPSDSKNHTVEGVLLASLDRDDTRGNGRETITVYTLPDSPLTYSVHDYTNQGHGGSLAMAGSDAMVQVYRGNQMVRQFNILPNTPAIVWDVFQITPEGELVVLDQYRPDSVSAQSVGTDYR